ncbi:MAG: DUF6785 family protein [Armatimonadota bacterium]|nr:hypothetical protein [Armatimonadota bacterium]MCX7778456.1 hypothetical protein [Armatimonadota bacterium]MDW8026523.1 DUF6785 family protein [Armatimonadota bacterium]
MHRDKISDSRIGTVELETRRLTSVQLAFRTAYVLTVAVGLNILCGVWIRQAEIVVLATQVSEAVPPVPAIGVLLLLLFGNLLLRLIHPAIAFSRAELMLIYFFTTISSSLPGCGIVRFLFALIGTPIYYASAENEFDTILWHNLPSWLVPMDRDAMRSLYLSSAAGIPWGVWLPKLAWWTLFFTLYWICSLGLVSLFARQWCDKEKLVFPLVQLPLEITRTEDGRLTFFRNRLMWLGFIASSFYNAMNMLNAYFPSVPAFGKFFDMGASFIESPWRALRPLIIWYRPELIGFGFLVPTDVSLSIWLSYMLIKVQAFVGEIIGYRYPGYPFPQEQSLGAYIAMAIYLIYTARLHIADALKRALGYRSNSRNGEYSEVLNPRQSLLLITSGFFGMVLFASMAGMATWLASLYFAIVIIVAFVYARIRAEVGIPLIWMFPFFQQKRSITYTLGTRPLLDRGGVKSMAAFALFTFMARGYYPELIGYQIEGVKMADNAGWKRSAIIPWSTIALIVGLWIGFYFHLTPYYHYGAIRLRGGIWGTWLAMEEYRAVVNAVRMPSPPEMPKVIATLSGAICVSLFAVIRLLLLQVPIHPLGYAMAGAYGDLIWGPFFIVWLLKTLILRYAGGVAYRKCIPLFLGFALGHYFTAGLVWGLWSVTGAEVFSRYGVWFG